MIIALQPSDRGSRILLRGHTEERMRREKAQKKKKRRGFHHEKGTEINTTMRGESGISTALRSGEKDVRSPQRQFRQGSDPETQGHHCPATDVALHRIAARREEGQ